MTDNNHYKFKLLNETSASEDLFEYKTHQQIADTLCAVIQDESSEGVTIGLEGGWGSGKSTVVSILKHKLESNPNIIHFYFDAWAHEGDPLRRVFLEALIDQVGHEDNKLHEIKERVSNRKRTSSIKSKQTVTALGKWLAFAALFVPLGAAIISDTASKVGFQFKEGLNWIFLFGLICVLSPLYVLGCNFCKLKKEHNDVKDLNNWMFLQNESVSTVTQEISEDDERSSIEFERYFCEILDILFAKKGNAKLLIVVDNLDRVDAADSLKIWSTLQTFLQRRNPTGYSNTCFNKIWVLVPYDEEGLAKLWDQQTQNPTTLDDNEKSGNRDCAKSFFDKCFQLRIEVPKLILTGWESFCEENIDKALIDWKDKEKKDVLNVLKWTRNSVDDIPTPREIKTYINQVGLLRLHCDKNISTTAIAYFAVQKYMKFQTNRKIESLIISDMLPPNTHKPIFHEGLTSELCGILFGVSSEKGQQLLLEPIIEQALDTKDLEKTNALSKAHKNAFWTVLDLHLAHVNDYNKMIRYSSTVWHGLWKTYPEKCQSFINYLKATTDGLNSLDFPAQNDVEGYVAVFSLLEEGNYVFSKSWLSMLQSLNKLMKDKDFDYSNGNKTLTALAACQRHKIPSPYLLGSIPIEHWMKWATACNSEGLESYSFIKPPRSFIKDIAAQFVAGSPIPDGLRDLIIYLVKGGEAQWEPVISDIKSYIEWNQGTPSNNIFSIEIFKILSLISVSGQKTQKLIEPILRSGAFYNLTFHINSQGADKYAALLVAKCLPEELNSLQVASVSNSATGLQQVRNFWKTNNNVNAQFVLKELMYGADSKFIWDLAKDDTNTLIGDVIKIAVNDSPAFFNYTNSLHLLKVAINLTGNDILLNGNLANCFIKHSQIEKEILEAVDLDIISLAQELNLVVENTKNKQVPEHIMGRFNDITKEQWKESLTNNDYLTALAVSIKGKTPKFKLGDNLYEPLLSYLESWISNSATPDDVQISELLELITMLKNNFQTQLRIRLASYLVEIGFNGNLDAVTALFENVNIKNVVSEGEEKIQNVLEDSIRNSGIAQMEIIDLILSHKDSVAFKPAPHLAEVFQTPMKDLLNTHEGIDVALVERLASKFGVDLSKPYIEDENRDNSVDENAN